MTRVSMKDLEQLVRVLNNLTGSPVEPWTKGPDGKFKSNPGCFHLDHAYGAPRLVRITGEHGTERDISPRLPNGELSRWLHAYIDGVDLAQRGHVELPPRIETQEGATC